MVHFVILLSLLSAIHATDYNRRCLLFDGKCVAVCPRNMHPYHTRCDGETLSQRTCASPLVYIIGYTCGWSRCDCNGDLMLDEDSGFCVKDKECPLFQTKKPGWKYRDVDRRKKGKRKSYSKRIRITEDELTDLI